MHVDVEQTRGDEQIAHIDAVLGLGGGDIRLNAGDLAVFDANIAHPVDLVGRVYDVSSLEQKLQFLGHGFTCWLKWSNGLGSAFFASSRGTTPH